MDVTQVAAHTLFLATLVWAIVQYGVKPMLGKDVDVNPFVLMVAVALGVVYQVAPGAIQGYIDGAGQLVLASLTANVAHNIAVGISAPKQ